MASGVARTSSPAEHVAAQGYSLHRPIHSIEPAGSPTGVTMPCPLSCNYSNIWPANTSGVRCCCQKSITTTAAFCYINSRDACFMFQVKPYHPPSAERTLTAPLPPQLHCCKDKQTDTPAPQGKASWAERIGGRGKRQTGLACNRASKPPATTHRQDPARRLLDCCCRWFDRRCGWFDRCCLVHRVPNRGWCSGPSTRRCLQGNR